MRHDSLDVLALASAAVLFSAAAGLAVRGDSGGARSAANFSSISTPRICSDLVKCRAIFDAGKPAKAVEKLKEFTAANPDIAEGHLLLAKSYAALTQYPAAMKEYRMALVLDPEYADKSSEKFIGKTIKSILRNGWAPCEVTLGAQKNTNDEARTATLDDAKYIQRMLAGGCE